jgi:hypothetical protein
MRKRSSKKPADEPVAEERTAPVPPPAPEPTPDGKNPAAVVLGRLGGKKGGPARARKLTKEQRAEIARKAAQARWAKKQV